MGARHYDPTTGRFLSPDPVGHPITLNLYTYANGDPINFYDPDGRFANAVYESIDTTRVFGGMQALGGAVEVAIGGGICTYSGGIAIPLGGAVIMTHGLDNFFTGSAAFFTGTRKDTVTSTALQGAGLSRGSAETIDMSLSLGFTMGGAASLNSVRAGASTAFKLPTTVLNEVKVTQPIIDPSANVNRSTSFAGRRYAPLDYAPYQKIRNQPTTINGRKYTGHALDRMQDRGFTPSVIENTITNGRVSSSELSGGFEYYDPQNKIRVIVGESGQIVTVIPGKG